MAQDGSLMGTDIEQNVRDVARVRVQNKPRQPQKTVVQEDLARLEDYSFSGDKMNTYDIPEIQRKISTKVLAYAQASDKSFSFDPWTIFAICNCIISVCKLLYMCYSSKGVANAIKGGSLLHKIVLKREIRKKFKDKSQRRVMFESMLEVGASLSEMELNQLMESIQE